MTQHCDSKWTIHELPCDGKCANGREHLFWCDWWPAVFHSLSAADEFLKGYDWLAQPVPHVSLIRPHHWIPQSALWLAVPPLPLPCILLPQHHQECQKKPVVLIDTVAPAADSVGGASIRHIQKNATKKKPLIKKNPSICRGVLECRQTLFTEDMR